MRDYLLNILFAVDELFNAMLGGRHDETISERMGWWYSAGGLRSVVAKPVCWFLNGVHPEHVIVDTRDRDRDT